MRRIRRVNRYGSIVLEASISISIVILLLCAMISSITTVNAEIYMQRATENVVAEMNVAIPFVSNGFSSIDELITISGEDKTIDSDHSSLNQAMNVFESASGETKNIVFTSTLGRYVRDRIQIEYDKLISNGWVYQHLVSNLSVYVDMNADERSIYLHVFYDIGVGDYTLQREYCTSLAIYSEMEIVDSTLEHDQSESDGIWEKDNFERGIIFREKYGGNLPHNYPVICAFDDGHALSVKSIDTTAPQYQVEQTLEKKIKSYIRDLSLFETSQYGEYSINEGEITSKTLIIVIPENGSDSCERDFLRLEEYANERNVEMRVEKYGNSHRFSDCSDT